MRALVFGGTGMLGRAVAAEWRRRGEAVLALSHHQADVGERESLLYWAREFRPRVVINCAAMTQVDLCESEKERAFAINGRAVAHVASAAAAADALLVQVSTDYVFNGHAETPYREDAPTAPLSVYGASKLQGEHEALSYPRSIVLRTSWLFGPGGPNFVLTIRRLLRERRLPLRVVDDQRGCPTYTPYLARAIADLVVSSEMPYGTLHYRNREPVSWHGFATEIARYVAPAVEVEPIPTRDFPRPAARPSYSVLDVTRFEATVGRRVEAWGSGLTAYLDILGENP